MATHKSVETKYLEERQNLFHGLRNLDRRSFLKVSAAAVGATAGSPPECPPGDRGPGRGKAYRNRPFVSPISRTRTCTRIM